MESEPPPCVVRAQGFCAGSVDGPRGTAGASPQANPHHCSRRPSAGRDSTQAPAGPDWRTRLLGPQEWPGRGRRRHLHGTKVFPAGKSLELLRPLLLLRKGPKPNAALARVSLAGVGERGAPNLGYSGPALCCPNLSPPGHSHSPLPLSFVGLQGQADTTRAITISRYLATLLAKCRVTAVCCPQSLLDPCSLARA